MQSVDHQCSAIVLHENGLSIQVHCRPAGADRAARAVCPTAVIHDRAVKAFQIFLRLTYGAASALSWQKSKSFRIG